ncbi:MAG: LytTR family transcriptional regulator DNA-binding domain-containing protein [Clostridiales bacterium]|nr:LytTR family transcriptional regulator DNA-binding domain-containing protein [Clostridiales bacterium]
MKLILKENKDLRETEVEIRYRKRDEEVESLISAVKDSCDRLVGYKDNGDSMLLTYSKVLYFEAVDRYVFAYTSSEVLKIKHTLYELEDECQAKGFVRISKSVIVNLNTVKRISPDEGRKLRLHLTNGEAVIVSRNFVGDLKTAIGMKGDA